MTIFSLAITSLQKLEQVASQQQKILAGQEKLAQQNTAIISAVNTLAVKQEQQGAALENIIAAVKSTAGMTARMTLGTPISQ